jgi:hypothetical protein
VVDEGDEIGVVEEIAQFIFDIAEVDVDGRRAQLERGERGLDVFVAVVEVEADVIAGLHATCLQVMREPRRPLVDIGKREAPIAVDDGGALADVVGDVFEEVCEVEVEGHEFTVRSSQFVVCNWSA